MGFDFAIAAWLWFTVLFANFAEAVAEGRGKAQADFLRRTKSDTTCALQAARERRTMSVVRDGLRKGDLVRVDAGEIRFRPTVTYSRARRRSTNPRSPANRRRLFAKRAEIAVR